MYISIPWQNTWHSKATIYFCFLLQNESFTSRMSFRNLIIAFQVLIFLFQNFRCFSWRNKRLTITLDMIFRDKKNRKSHVVPKRRRNAAEKFPLPLSFQRTHIEISLCIVIDKKVLSGGRLNKLYRNERDLGRGYVNHYHSLIIRFISNRASSSSSW